MESAKYKKLVSEIRSLMPTERIGAILEMRLPSERIDALMDLLRKAVLRSTLHYYNGSPYFFTGRIYEPMEWDDFGNMVYDVLRKCGLPDGNYSRLEYVIRVCRRAIRGKELTPDPAIVVFRNCVFDMDSCLSHDFDSRYVAVTEVDYDFEPEAYPTQWQFFLDRVLPDERLQSILAQFLGAVFINRRMAKIEQMLVLLGSGANGKSVVFETVMGLFGRDNVSTFGIGSLIHGTESKRNIATINGKRLNYCSEIKTVNFGRDSDTLKTLVSGESTPARAMYGDNFMANDIPLLMANANRMPYLMDCSEAMRRRIIVLPFDVEIPPSEQDKELSAKLRHEYPAIFNWIMDGRKEFIRNKYCIKLTDELTAMMDEYQAESSTVMTFMLSNKYLCRYPETSVEPVWVLSSRLFSEYTEWCMANNIAEQDREKINEFGRVLKGAGYKRKRTPDGVTYALYCDNIKWSLNYEKEKGVQRRPTAEEKPFYDFDGVKWVKSRRGLALALGLSENRLISPIRSGVLTGCFRVDGKAKIYNIEACRKALADYFQGEQAKMLENQKKKEMGFKRAKFNQRMQEIGEPYRKYAERFAKIGIPAGVIHVPDDWEYEDMIPIEQQSNLVQRRQTKIEYINYADEEEQEEAEEYDCEAEE